jgi:hypothetical protein
MTLLQQLKNVFSRPATAPDVVFGRYSDAIKTPQQQAAWEQAIKLFDAGRPMDAYRQMLVFFKQPNTDNLSWSNTADGIQFSFWQGSRRIDGHVNAQYLKAESKIAYAPDEHLHIGFLRRLVEQTFKLRYTRYALSPDHYLMIVFDTSLADGSPLKAMHALRELALHADKLDDLLLEEYASLAPVAQDAATFMALPEQEKIVKFKFFQQELFAAFQVLEQGQPNPDQYPSGYAYLLLSTVFRLDYLIRPEGFTMDLIERAYLNYFSKNELGGAVKVQQLAKTLRPLLDRGQAQFYAELYRTRSTFGANMLVNEERVKTLIRGELPKMEWSIQQKHPEAIQIAVPDYVVGYALYIYAMPEPIRAFFHLYYQITRPAYFRELGFTDEVVMRTEILSKKIIGRAIKSVAAHYQKSYHRMKPNLERLTFESMPLFARSYLLMVAEMDFE